jgi:hypothetical protein
MFLTDQDDEEAVRLENEEWERVKQASVEGRAENGLLLELPIPETTTTIITNRMRDNLSRQARLNAISHNLELWSETLPGDLSYEEMMALVEQTWREDYRVMFRSYGDVEKRARNRNLEDAEWERGKNGPRLGGAEV